ncbi:MAG: hypothetical protein L3J19_00245 [Sulfurimonas sp.]|nr:hypothetical protein [Sulfurimonas sp.]
MINILSDNYEFMTSAEINKSIAQNIKIIRKRKFKTQELFAKHIGMSYGKYARFEKTGQISFQGFIDILKGIDRVEEITKICNIDSEAIQWK